MSDLTTAGLKVKQVIPVVGRPGYFIREWKDGMWDAFGPDTLSPGFFNNVEALKWALTDHRDYLLAKIEKGELL